MTVQNPEVVEVPIGATVTVPFKYAAVISLMTTTEKTMWQEVADSWIQMIRRLAAEGNMEVDDFIAKIISESGQPVEASE